MSCGLRDSFPRRIDAKSYGGDAAFHLYGPGFSYRILLEEWLLVAGYVMSNAHFEAFSKKEDFKKLLVLWIQEMKIVPGYSVSNDRRARRWDDDMDLCRALFLRESWDGCAWDMDAVQRKKPDATFDLTNQKDLTVISLRFSHDAPFIVGEGWVMPLNDFFLLTSYVLTNTDLLSRTEEIHGPFSFLNHHDMEPLDFSNDKRVSFMEWAKKIFI